MTITVEIARQDDGLLKAFVVQEGIKGKNLLRCHISNVATARERLPGILKHEIKLLDFTIEWTGEQPEEPKKLSDKPVQGARDRYGWRSI